MILPEQIIKTIYEFNADHRALMRQVMDELLWEMYEDRHYLYKMQDELLRRVLCENCNEPKPVMHMDLEFCSSTCYHQARDNPYKLY